MKYIKGDLFKSDEWDAYVHVCNNYKTFGAGFARIVQDKHPKVYQADLESVDGNSKLGSFTYNSIYDNSHRVGINLYAMNGVGNIGTPMSRNLSYDHLYNALYKACRYFRSDYFDSDDILKIGVPNMIGCGLAGGEVTIVESILRDMESKFNVQFLIYVLG